MKDRKKILVAVTGMSPQIVTETVYALHESNREKTDDEKWLPEKIIVLTTLRGKAKIMSQLLGENGHFHRLCKDYELPEIEFGEHTIKVISENGAELDDIRTAEQNNAAADLIVREIYELCQDENTALHVSIAGGRKSMGFYIGYALSLFGRAQDRMSHVLVENDYERFHDFFYPTPYDCTVHTYPNGDKPIETANAKLAKIIQAEIPFVRMTTNPLSFAFHNNNMTFSQAVEHTQKMLRNDVKIKFDLVNKIIMIGNSIQLKDISPTDFCIYAAMAERHKFNQVTAFSDEMLTREFIQSFMKFYPHFKVAFRDRLNSQSVKQELAQFAEDLLQNEPTNKGTPRAKIARMFNESNSHIKKALKKQLGDYGLRFAIDSQGKNNSLSYFLKIDPNDIVIE
ncbi:CRISPR-associated ring nuclease Csm6 [Kingella negevensis]|uniref:CRISPR-associated protein (Cas_NE0113) n=1 Tax=Kingella negevensis TaxID=1522312 RepID=A0A238HGR1_9NEIS|nr:CRISPR-associated ring nuclease Csm6 [Kingella negevensis]MDK4681160.1 CRISPR-associated ring nuclease Csm6 [Kingella negevensis]MDK4683363.1 CRISPR-associated ring nuclease Csm6 [Kingella negevensis]MDK4685395.1 CRISPR-associated ring nuclease Csm6 [Kingella negevensis]MDK4691507.1 CRISPR-associated ring nuclease Csm6 [Kingella negevensis]MDK4693342.1 CRISPR-associated ring nuclease Csm6 [Kingella negevensis]